MNTSNYLNDFPEGREFPDDVHAEPLPEPLLHLSVEDDNAKLDDFEFILEDDDDGACLFADSNSSSGFVGELLEISLNEMPIESIQENEEVQLPRSYQPRSRPRRSQRDRSPIPQAKKRFHMMINDEVNFDPPMQQHQQRQTSYSDLSMCSAQSNTTQYSESQYSEALQNLAESMKRSNESRRVVAMMQRRMLTPEQRQVLMVAKERLQKENEQIVAAQQWKRQNQQQEQQSSIMANLFSGSCGVLSNGLEQGRKQLGMYMSQVNHQTM